MLEFFLSYLLVYTYLVLFFVTLSAAFLLPLPSTALMMAAWAFAAQGYLDLWYVLIVSFIWCVIGDLAGYFVSFLYWKKLLSRIGFNRVINSNKFLWLENYFKNNSIKSILISRFLITWLSVPINILSWLTGIKFKKFFSYNIIGEIIHVFLFVGIGYFLWYQWQNITTFLEYIIAILVLIVLLVIVIKFTFWNYNELNKTK